VTLTPTLVSPAFASRTLHASWQVRVASGPAPADIAQSPTPATVPGCVHTDLLEAGLIPDPFLDTNESALAWIGLTDWTYATNFDWTPDSADRTELVFDGLDAVTEITLNGRHIGSTANQHRSYRFEVQPLLRDGTNELVVAFRSPVKYADAQSVAHGVRPRPYPSPYNAVRKAASSFGWDWGIATTTSGIVKPVRLETWTMARLDSVRVSAQPTSETSGTIDIAVELVRSRNEHLSIIVRAGKNEMAVDVPADSTTAQLSLDLDDIELWWPAGYGDQPLYDVDIELATADGRILQSINRRVGFRTLRWDTTPDETGTPFTLVVNDRAVFVKGANWIPDDALTVRTTRERVSRRLAQALTAHLNLIRVWGGGLYESDDFYELADELGLLVWQDFPFACAAYAEEEPLRSEIEMEARENIARLAHHASLALLTGNNESTWGYEDWDWKLLLDGKTWGAYYYYELLPSIVDELAPWVPYAAGSPFSPSTSWDGTAQRGDHPNSESHGTAHLWEQWNRLDWLTYRNHRPRFVAEFGWQGPPTWSTLTRTISDDPLTPESPGIIAHQKAIDGNTKLTSGLLPHFRLPEEMETWHWAMQLNQALALRTAIEHFRSWTPHTMGAIVWQLNDSWPVISWSVIDANERPKPAYHALRAAFAPRVATIQPRDEQMHAVLVNDTDDTWTGDVVLRRLTFEGQELARLVESADIDPRTSQAVPIPSQIAVPDDAAREFISVSSGGVRGLWFFTEPRDSALQSAQVNIRTEAHPEGTLVTATAFNLVRDLTLLADKLDPAALVSDSLVTLLPGESTTLLIRHAGNHFPPAAVSDPQVMRTANELVTP